MTQYKRGDFVTLNFAGTTRRAMVGLAVEGGAALILFFTGNAGSYTGTMGLQWDAAQNEFVDLLGHQVATLTEVKNYADLE